MTYELAERALITALTEEIARQEAINADLRAQLAAKSQPVAAGQKCGKCGRDHFTTMRNALAGIFDYSGNDIEAVRNTAYRALPNTDCLLVVAAGEHEEARRLLRLVITRREIALDIAWKRSGYDLPRPKSDFDDTDTIRQIRAFLSRTPSVSSQPEPNATEVTRDGPWVTRKPVYIPPSVSTSEEEVELKKLRQAIGWICDAADAAYIEDEHSKYIHDIFNIAAKATGITRRLPDEHNPFEL